MVEYFYFMIIRIIFVASNATYIQMRKKDKYPERVSQKKVESEEKNVEEDDETGKFIKRLEIQRKLLNNFIDLTKSQNSQIIGEENSSN